MFMQLLAGTGKAADDWKNIIMKAVDNIMVPLLVIACSIGIIYAVIVGIKMMKADNKDQREENKQKLINIAISIVAIAVLIALFYALRSWLTTEGRGSLEDEMTDIINPTPEHIGSNLLNTFQLVGQCARMAIFKC